VANPLNAQAGRHADEPGLVIQVKYLLGRHLRQVKRQAEDVNVGLAEAHEGGGHEKIHEFGQPKRVNPVRVQLAGTVKFSRAAAVQAKWRGRLPPTSRTPYWVRNFVNSAALSAGVA